MDPLKKIQSKTSSQLSSSYLSTEANPMNGSEPYHHQTMRLSSLLKKSTQSKSGSRSGVSNLTGDTLSLSPADTTTANKSNVDALATSQQRQPSIITSTPMKAHQTRGNRKSYSSMLSPTRQSYRSSAASAHVSEDVGASTSSRGTSRSRKRSINKQNSTGGSGNSRVRSKRPSSNNNPMSRIRPKELLCICRTAYDETKYV